MPHICTRCNSVFESGEDILQGCPACGWKKFLFVRKMTQKADVSMHSKENIITRAMGVRVPPKSPEKDSMAMEKARPPVRDLAPSPSLSTPVSRPTQASTESGYDHQSELKKSGLKPVEGKALESIKITAPGTYELNLSSLFERDELIMAVKEGTYFIDLTSAFKKVKKD